MIRMTTNLAVLGTVFTLAFAAPAGAANAPPAYATAAVSDASRPDADKNVDADRKPAEMVVFAGIKPGDKVVDLLPGGGYFTRVFAKAVGPKGHVYAVVPDEMIKLRATAADPIKAIADDKGYGNVTVVTGPMAGFKVDAPADVVWTSRNYHDLHNKMFGPTDMTAFNKAVFAALKPGGTYIVLDHAAAPGSGFEATEALHRVDPEAVKKEVTAAGFQFVAADDTLKNAADDHTGKVFDANVRGKTDQFVLKFKKP
jgi:predicted methyltransferase